MHLLLGNESNTFELVATMDEMDKVAKKFRVRHKVFARNHLCSETLLSALDRFLDASRVVQGVEFFSEKLKHAGMKLGSVVDVFIGKITHFMRNFITEMVNLKFICIYQSGELTMGEWQLSEPTQLADLVNKTLSVLSLLDVIESRLLDEVKVINSLLAHGILDF